MLQQNHDDIDNLWIIIKKVRKDYFSHNVDTECFIQIAENDIKTVIDNVEENLIKKSTEYDSHDNITEDILQVGAEMFIYLNFCPPNKLMKFYKEVLLKQSTKDIILAMTNIIKTRRNAEKSTATRIWSKIDQKLRNLRYRVINSVTLRHFSEFVDCKNKSCSEEMKSLGFKCILIVYELILVFV